MKFKCQSFSKYVRGAQTLFCTITFFYEYILQLLAVGKLTRAPLLNVFSKKPQEEDREGRQPFPFKWLIPGLEPVFQHGDVWADCAPNFKAFTENHCTSWGFFLYEGFLPQDVEK